MPAPPGARARGAGVKVGVIDGGVDFTHPDLAGAIDVARSCSFIYSTTPTADPAEVANGDCGTSPRCRICRGTAHTSPPLSPGAATGSALSASRPSDHRGAEGLHDRRLLLRRLGRGGAALRGRPAARRGESQPLRRSLPLLLPTTPSSGPSCSDLQRAARYAQQRGVVIVASAGNESDDLGHPDLDEISPDWPPDTAVVRSPQQLPRGAGRAARRGHRFGVRRLDARHLLERRHARRCDRPRRRRDADASTLRARPILAGWSSTDQTGFWEALIRRQPRRRRAAAAATCGSAAPRWRRRTPPASPP